jgi:hypothetical protein
MLKLDELDGVLLRYTTILVEEAAARERLRSWGDDPYVEISSAMSLRAEVLDRRTNGEEEI